MLQLSKENEMSASSRCILSEIGDFLVPSIQPSEPGRQGVSSDWRCPAVPKTASLFSCETTLIQLTAVIKVQTSSWDNWSWPQWLASGLTKFTQNFQCVILFSSCRMEGHSYVQALAFAEHRDTNFILFDRHSRRGLSQ